MTQSKMPPRGSKHVTPPRRNNEKQDRFPLIEPMLTGVDRIRRENGITLEKLSAKLGIAVPAISQHLKMSRGFPDAETTLVYLQWAERMEPGFTKRLLK